MKYLQGRRLNSGASIRDYSVHIGHMECMVTDVGYNYLICEPPAEQPDNQISPSSDSVPVDVSDFFKLIFINIFTVCFSYKGQKNSTYFNLKFCHTENKSQHPGS